ncbi:hypothetical protein XCR_4187 [Xanthomonas campestris pv. raphani 756C]|nr:hypothetical protein XCR_4187 [Xanthomonas campestris pv. raphani 756C]
MDPARQGELGGGGVAGAGAPARARAARCRAPSWRSAVLP